MSNKHESMIGIMKLYDLRRDGVLREARKWFAGFNPDSFEDIVNTFTGEDDPYFRMVLSYWDMAASFVNHGAIDEQMFNEANVEHIFTFAKVEPFLTELRELTHVPQLLGNLEQLILRIPNAKEALSDIRARAKEKKQLREKAAGS